MAPARSADRSILSEIATDTNQSYDQRKEVVMAMASNSNASKKLLSIAEKGNLPPDLRLLVGGMLMRSSDAEVRRKATEAFPQPHQKDRKPLPPIDELASMNGDAENGGKLFRGVATCAMMTHTGSVGP